MLNNRVERITIARQGKLGLLHKDLLQALLQDLLQELAIRNKFVVNLYEVTQVYLVLLLYLEPLVNTKSHDRHHGALKRHFWCLHLEHPMCNPKRSRKQTQKTNIVNSKFEKKTRICFLLYVQSN